MQKRASATNIGSRDTQYGCVELFSGGGGLAFGIELAGFRHVLLAENDENARATIATNNNSRVYMHTWPLHDQPDAKLIDFTPFKGKAQLIAGGPPCQPFSIGGVHRGHLDERDMFPTAIRAVREIEPAAFLFENVRGLARPAFRDYVEYIRLHLSMPQLTSRKNESWVAHSRRLATFARRSKSDDDVPYNVEFHPLMCADYGAPQIRSRVFFVGMRKGLGLKWTYPAKTHDRKSLIWDQYVSGDYWMRHNLPQRKTPNDLSAVVETIRSSGERGTESAWQTVRDTISTLPPPAKAGNRVSKHHSQHVLIPGARSYAGHSGSPLDWPAKALKAGVHGVPGGENMLADGRGKVRYFTVREAACLQGFPVNYIFEGSWVEVMRQIGNAVPVMVAHKLALTIRDEFQRAGVLGF